MRAPSRASTPTVSTPSCAENVLSSTTGTPSVDGSTTVVSCCTVLTMIPSTWRAVSVRMSDRSSCGSFPLFTSSTAWPCRAAHCSTATAISAKCGLPISGTTSPIICVLPVRRARALAFGR